jgi:metal-responsive CopG/Arc/MetJ family transcriptional regulator
MAKKYRDIKLPEEIAKIIDEHIIGREGYRSRCEYAIKIIIQDLIKRGVLKRENGVEFYEYY